MTLQLEVGMLGGARFAVAATTSWSVWDLKCKIARDTGKNSKLLKLTSSQGEELMDRKAVREYCPSKAVTELMLFEMPKTDEEIAAHERWLQTTPMWWKESAEIVRSNEDFENLRGYEELLTKNSKTATVQQEDRRVLETSSAVLAVIRRGGFHLTSYHWCSPDELGFDNNIGECFRAAREVVYEAIEQYPETILPHVDVDHDILRDILGKYPGVFKYLPPGAREHVGILYTALSTDDELKEDFLRTAGKTEINKWRWSAEKMQGERDERRSRWLKYKESCKKSSLPSLLSPEEGNDLARAKIRGTKRVEQVGAAERRGRGAGA